MLADLAIFANGFLLGAGLIIAIGAQNAFVLRQGLLRRHVGPVVALGATADAALIAVGVFAVGSLARSSGPLLTAVFFAGAAFLAVYAAQALYRAVFRADALEAARADAERPLGPTLAAMAAFTFLNPHVYLDTVLLVGGISAKYAPEPRVWFAAGAMCASFAWFSALGYGARLLQPVFRRAIAWRVLDLIIAVVMGALAFGLAQEGFSRL